MGVREKLVEFIDDFIYNVDLKHWYSEELDEKLADYLLDQGVTVQEWVPVMERLPTIYDADDDNCVLAIHKATNKRYYHWRSVENNPFDFTYWTRTPHPPKGE